MITILHGIRKLFLSVIFPNLKIISLSFFLYFFISSLYYFSIFFESLSLPGKEKTRFASPPLCKLPFSIISQSALCFFFLHKEARGRKNFFSIQNHLIFLLVFTLCLQPALFF